MIKSFEDNGTQFFKDKNKPVQHDRVDCHGHGKHKTADEQLHHKHRTDIAPRQRAVQAMLSFTS